MAIQVVTIDFWNTLFTTANGEQREQHRLAVIRSHAERLGARVSDDILRAAQAATWQEFKRIWKREHRTPTTEELVRFFFRTLKLEPDATAVEEVAHELAYGILEHPPALLPGAASVLEHLVRQGFQLAVISDTAFSPGAVLRKVMEQAGIAEFFAAYSFSDQTGVSKPHPEAYLYALRQLNASPQAAVHIGDIERTDVAGAKALGMYAVLFRGDHNAVLEEEYVEQSQADHVVFHWDEVPPVVERIHKQGSQR